MSIDHVMSNSPTQTHIGSRFGQPNWFLEVARENHILQFSRCTKTENHQQLGRTGIFSVSYSRTLYMHSSHGFKLWEEDKQPTILDETVRIPLRHSGTASWSGEGGEAVSESRNFIFRLRVLTTLTDTSLHISKCEARDSNQPIRIKSGHVDQPSHSS